MLQSTLGTALKGGWGAGEKEEKKCELCVAGENLLELERTKGGEGGGSSCGGAHIATEIVKMENYYYFFFSQLAFD